MSVPGQLFLSGNMSWTDEELLEELLTIFIVILTMALIALIMVGAIKTWLALRRAEHSNDMEMDTVNEDNVAQTTFTAVETNDYPL